MELEADAALWQLHPKGLARWPSTLLRQGSAELLALRQRCDVAHDQSAHPRLAANLRVRRSGPAVVISGVQIRAGRDQQAKAWRVFDRAELGQPHGRRFPVQGAGVDVGTSLDQRRQAVAMLRRRSHHCGRLAVPASGIHRGTGFKQCSNALHMALPCRQDERRVTRGTVGELPSVEVCARLDRALQGVEIACAGGFAKIGWRGFGHGFSLSKPELQVKTSFIFEDRGRRLGLYPLQIPEPKELLTSIKNSLSRI